MEPSPSEQEWLAPKPRGLTPEPPYAWVDKRTLRAIREHFDGDSKEALALAAYHALAEIASDEGSASFTALIPYIGLKAGISGKSVERVLPELEKIKAVAIQRTAKGGKGPNLYILLSMNPLAQSDATSRRIVATPCPRETLI